MVPKILMNKLYYLDFLHLHTLNETNYIPIKSDTWIDIIISNTLKLQTPQIIVFLNKYNYKVES